MAGVAPPPERLEREYGCTEAEWLRWMREITAPVAHPSSAPASLEIALEGGVLHLSWQVLPARAIALVQLPRLSVQFRFDDVPPAARAAFMRRFDMHLQRGGG